MANIIITFRHPTEREKLDNNSDFWIPFYNAADKVRGEFTERIDQKIFEGRIRKNFPLELKRLLSTFTPPVSTVGLEAKTNLSASIAIAVEYVKKGSLELGLIIEPIDKLGKLFDNNFEYFEAFLKSYIPIAFIDSLNPQFRPEYIGWNDVVDLMEIDINPTNDFRTNFQKNNFAQTSVKESKSITNKANWLWIISNTSLVVPVLLASLALYFSYNRLNEKETNFEKKTEQLIEQQNKLIDELLNKQDNKVEPKDEKK